MMELQISRSRKTPIYRRIADAVCDAVASGELGPGDKLPTKVALAKRLGVNALTVSRGYGLLQSRGIVIQKQGSGTYVEFGALGRVNGAAGRAYGTLTMVIGETSLAQCQRENMFIMVDLLDGLRDVLGPCGPHIVFAESFDGALMSEVKKDDAFALVYPKAIDPSVIVECQRRRIPALALWDDRVAPGLPCVDYDREQSAAIACEHLIDCGYRRLGFIGVRSDRGGPIAAKFGAFTRMLNEKGMDVRADYVREVPVDPGKAYAAAQSMIRAGTVPDALFVDTDYKAMEVICAFNDAGLRVPDDVGILSFDDVPEAAQHTPPLSTVRVPRREIGRRAARMLLDWPKGRDIPGSIKLTSTLMVRGTTILQKDFE